MLFPEQLSSKDVSLSNFLGSLHFGILGDIEHWTFYFLFVSEVLLGDLSNPGLTV